MKKFKNILFVSALLSMTVFMSCTEDDDLEDIENGDNVSNDSTGVANDSTDVDVVKLSSFMTLGEDTILIGLGCLRILWNREMKGRYHFWDIQT